jgi:antitoxin component of MazEF toxin-antitoxin module
VLEDFLMSTTYLRKWGNSIGVRIPKEALEKSRIQTGDILEVVAERGVISIQKKNFKKFSDFAEPLFDTKSYKFDREEANER